MHPRELRKPWMYSAELGSNRMHVVHNVDGSGWTLQAESADGPWALSRFVVCRQDKYPLATLEEACVVYLLAERT